MGFKDYIKESSLSRLWRHMQEHDAGVITAFRKHEYDEDGNIVRTYTKKENKARNYLLKAKLLRKYDVTAVRGSYIENFGTQNAVEVGENVFFVVDNNDRGTLENDLRKLGRLFNQDSIMFIPKGASSGILWGTKKDEFSNQFAYPSFGQKIVLKNAVWGKEGEFMTRISGRPFYFKEEMEIVLKPEGYFGNYGLYAVAKEDDWKLFIDKC